MPEARPPLRVTSARPILAAMDRDPSEGRRRRPPKKSSNAWLVPVLVVVVLGGGAAFAVLQGERDARQAEGAAQAAERDGKPKPFANVPDDVPPPPRSAAGGKARKGTAPDGLAQNPVWQRALEQAEMAQKLYDEATAAKVEGDTKTLNAKGNEAKALYDQALEDTAVWEEELVEKYGDGEPQVAAIMRVRSRWFDRTRWLHKSTSR